MTGRDLLTVFLAAALAGSVTEVFYRLGPRPTTPATNTIRSRIVARENGASALPGITRRPSLDCSASAVDAAAPKTAAAGAATAAFPRNARLDS